MALSEWMPIVDARMAGTRFPAAYAEREITASVDLCDARGRLNPAAKGWARTPAIRANLAGHWPRKKRWNFWNWICPRFVFSVTLANIDYAAFCAFFFIDFESGEKFEGMAPAWPGSISMPDRVEQPVSFRGGAIDYTNANRGGDFEVRFNGRDKHGAEVRADFVVRKPEGNESLTVVVPWSDDRFQMNCKENTRPCEGTITVGDRRYAMNPNDCHAVQDFGRGMWPYRSFWNWGVGTGVQDGRRVGINVGARWTTGTGANENALCIDGRLHKIMEDLVWEYDAAAPMQPWRVRSTHTEVVDIALQPIFPHDSKLSLGVLASGGVCVFGKWSGRLVVDGRSLRIENLIGWAEEFAHRW
jgi:hypothetical protein